MNKPKRHHYIPQFILRKFCYEDEELWFYDIKTKVLESSSTRDIFMGENLYLDKSNGKDSLEIEKEFGKYENEISQILDKQFYDQKNIYITKEEEESIKLFYALIGFRSKNAAEYFQTCKDENFISFYKNYQKDEDFDQLWKRNLKNLAKCRSYKQVKESPNIDDPFKLFMLRDTTGAMGSYLKVIEAQNDEFVLTDAFPLVIYGLTPQGVPINLFEMFPLSPKRAILLIYNFVPLLVDYNDSILPKGFFTKPELEDRKIKLYVKKTNDEYVRALNKKTVEITRIGIVSRTGDFKQYFSD